MQDVPKIEDLFTNAHPLDEADVVSALMPFVTIHTDTKEIYLKSLDGSKVEDKILAFALAKKMLKARGFIEKESISAVEFHKKTGIKKGSVDPSFKKLKDDGYIVGSGNDYEIPNYMVGKVAARLKQVVPNK